MSTNPAALDGDSMKEIELTRGKVAIVDDDEYAHLSRLKWTYLFRKTGGYAAHYWREGDCVHSVRMHRLVMGAMDGEQVDHINGNGLDNRKANLRLCTHTENTRNRRVSNGRRYKGVKPSGGKWCAHISVDKKHIWLGTFETEDDAARAYNKAAKKHFGAFANLNVIGGRVNG
jgi:hypothetical protein